MNYNIAVIPGDGIGPEVIDESIKVLNKIGEKYNHTFEFEFLQAGGCAIDSMGTPLPEKTLERCKESDAVLLGAVGGTKWDNPNAKIRPEQALLGLRGGLNLYCNLRPALLYKPLKRNKKLTSVDKANILESSRLWRSVVEEMSKEYPEVEVNHLYIDNASMQLVRDPKQFDVIVTSNMFGDILSDEASMITGSIGMLPSASLGEGTLGMYEPIHGSAPDIAGKGIANPLATILSTAMMLRYSFNLEQEARDIEDAVIKVLEEGYRTGDIKSKGTTLVGTKEMGQLVVEKI